MAEIKSIEKDRFNLIISEKGFLPELLTKDYYITVLLYLLKISEAYTSKAAQLFKKQFLAIPD